MIRSIRQLNFKWKIAMIGGITHPIISGFAYRTAPSPIMKWLYEHYDVATFSGRVPLKTYAENPRKIYMLSFARLPSLLYFLIAGRYHLFIVGMLTLETIITFIVAKLLRKPLIVMDEHWYWRRNLLMKLLWPFALFIARNTSYLIVPGQASKLFWKLANVPSKKLHEVHFDVEELKVEDRHVDMAKKIREAMGYRKVILYLGRLIEVKGVDILIRAFAKLSLESHDVVLLIAGEGKEKARLLKLCKQMGLDDKVMFVGFVPWKDRAAYFMACDVFVCPSITRGAPEVWGLVVNEAMSLGKPVVVTTAVGSAYDLVENGVNGYVVPEGNVDALYEAIKGIINDDKLRELMGLASQRLLAEKGFTYNHAIIQFSRIIKSALSFYSCKRND